MDFESKYNELRNKADRVNKLGDIYRKIEQDMRWEAMQWHDKDDEHEEAWFSVPEPDDYNYQAYLVYQEVLDAIEKLASK